jgi:phage major head subunit gpT-like protein
MPINTAAATATLRGLTAKFDMGVQAATPLYPELCTTFPSKGADERYAALGAMPGVREWVGDRIFNELRAADFTLANKQWESSLSVKKTDIADDRLGMYGPLLEQMGQEAALHPDQLFMEALVAGESQVCFDGQYFFDTDHSMGDSGTQDNDLTGAAATGTAPTEAEFRSAYHACRKAMLGFKRDNGKPFIPNIIRPLPNLLLLVPVDMEEVANQAINKTLVSGGETNVVLDKPRIMTSGALTNQAKFYLFNLSQPTKPFVFQAREPLTRQMKGMDDIEHKDVKFMTEARYNVGYMAWWNAVLYTFT